jgi:hypothetical protein
VGLISGVGMTSRVKTTRVASTNSGSVTDFGVQPIINMLTNKSKVMRAIVITSNMKSSNKATCEGF